MRRSMDLLGKTFEVCCAEAAVSSVMEPHGLSQGQ
jgi:hypothetical protein